MAIEGGTGPFVAVLHSEHPVQLAGADMKALRLGSARLNGLRCASHKRQSHVMVLRYSLLATKIRATTCGVMSLCIKPLSGKLQNRDVAVRRLLFV